MTRRDDLLAVAADQLDDLADPFHNAFLVEHDVTLNECGDMAEDLALAARLYLGAKRHPALLVALLLAQDGDGKLVDAALLAAASTIQARDIEALLARLAAKR